MHGNGCHGVHDCLVGEAPIDFGHVASEEEIGGRGSARVIVYPEERKGKRERRKEERGRGEEGGGRRDRSQLGRTWRLQVYHLLKAEQTGARLSVKCSKSTNRDRSLCIDNSQMSGCNVSW